jgi:hypothetical protein
VPRLTEGSHIEFRAEFYNTLNTPQFSAPATLNTGAAGFGQINGPTAVEPRLIQMGLKFIFGT